MKLEINNLALIGAIIGIVSLFLPWIAYYSMPGPWQVGYNLFTLSDFWYSGFAYPAIIFIVSSFFSLISPVAFIGQTGAMLLLLMVYANVNGPDPFEDTAGFRFGIFVGIASIVVLFLSMFFQAGKSNPRRSIRITERILTFIPMKKSD